MATITLSEYNINPNAYVGQTTKFNGKFVSKTEVDDQGSFDAQVELDSLLSGILITEPIHILVDSKNMFKDELIPYEGQDKVLEFECLIKPKPPGYHSFKLVKTLWEKDGFVSHNNRRGAGAQQQLPIPQAQQQLPVRQQTQPPSDAPPSFAPKAPIQQQFPGAGGFGQPQMQAPVYQPQAGTMYGQQPQQAYGYQQQAPPTFQYGQPTQTGYGQQIGAFGYQQTFPQQQVQQGYLPQQRQYQAPPIYGFEGLPQLPQYQQQQFPQIHIEKQ